MYRSTSSRRSHQALLLVAALIFQSFPVMRTNVVFAAGSSTTTRESASGARAETVTPTALPQRTPTPGQPSGAPPVTISATDNDTFPDPNLDGKVQAGETITYNVTITNSGGTDALNVVYNDAIDLNTSTLVSASDTLVFRNNADTYTAIGNVGINTDNIGGPGQSVVDNDAPNGATVSGFGNSLANANAVVPNGSNTVTTTNNGTVTMDPDGSFTFNPAAGFTGADSFFYTLSKPSGSGTASSAAKVTINVTGKIWFVNSAAAGGGNGTLASPFNCLVGAGCFDPLAADAAGDTIFLYAGTYTGGLTLLANQKVVGAGASASLATISGVTAPAESNSLPATGANPNTVTVTTNAAATDAINVNGGGNTLRGFTIGNTTGAKIFGIGFGTLTAGNSTTADLVLNGAGKALDLTSGTFDATSGFGDVITTSSGTQGISLNQIGGTVTLAQTQVSGSTTQGIFVNQSTLTINFNNTTVAAGTDGVSLQNNSSGTRTFGALTITGGSGVGFLHAVGGGTTTVTGATSITNPAGNGIDIQSSTTTIAFADATVNKDSSAGTGANLGGVASGNSGDVTFNSLAITTSNGSGLVGTNNTGEINVDTNAGNISSTGGPAIDITKSAAPATPVALNFSSVNSTNSAPTGVNIDFVSGNLTIGTSTVTNPTGVGISVQNTSAGGTMDFGNATSNASGGDGVFLNANGGNITFGALNINPDADVRAFHAIGNTGTITSTSGTIGPMTEAQAIDVTSSPLSMVLSSVTTNNTGDADSCITLTNTTGTLIMNGGTLTGGTGAAFFVDGGSVTTTFSGGITQASDAPTVLVVNDHNGTMTFNTGTISATNGTGLQFDDADGTYNFNGTNTLNGGDAGIDILNDATGTFNFSSSTSITNPSGTAFRIDDSNVSGTYGGSISDDTGFAVDINDHDSGTYTFDTGSITSTGQGVRVANSNGGTINFNSPTKDMNTGTNQAVTLDTNNGGGTVNFGNGGLNIDTTSGNGFSATGGGTVTVITGDDPNTIDTTAGTALNVSNTTIGASGLTFRSITSNGGSANGIVLDSAGAGGLTVAGDGGICTTSATCTGGTISNKTGSDGTGNGIGIYVNNTSNVSITRMKLNDFSNYAIRGTNVTNFTMNNCFLDGVNGDNAGADEGTIIFDDLLGTSSFTDDTIKGGIEDNFRIKNSSGTADDIAIDGCTISDSSTGVSGNDNLNVEANNTATITAHVTDNTFAATNGDHIQINTIDSATMNIVITGNLYSGGGGGSALLEGIAISGGNVGSTEHVNFNISNNGTAGNPLVGNIQGGAININQGQGAGTWQGQVSNNFIGDAGVANSGSAQSSGIRVENHSTNGTLTAIISGNTIRQWNNGPAINAQGGDAGNATNNGIINLTVTNNTATNPGAAAQHGFIANIGASGAVGDTYTACADVQSNTLDGNAANGGSGVRLRQQGSSTIELPGYGGAQYDTAAVIAFETSNNPASTPAPTATTSSAGPGYVNTPGSAQCTQPTVPTIATRANKIATLSSEPLSSYPVSRDKQNVVPQPTVSSTAKVLEGASVVSIAHDNAAAYLESRVTSSTNVAAVERHAAVAEALTSALGSRLDICNASAARSSSPTVREGISRVVRLNHVAQAQRSKPRIHTPSVGSVSINVGTIPAFSSVTIVYQVIVNNAAPAGANYVRDQGTVSGQNFASVLTVDPNPNPPGTTPPPNPGLETRTPLVHPTAAGSVISGILTDPDAAPLGGVVLQLTGGRRTITRADGKYQFEDVPTNDFYTLTPLLANHHFTPASRSFSLTGNMTDANFSAADNATQTANPLDTDMYFVRQQYLDILGREPDEGGLQYWTARVNGGCAPDDEQCLNARRIDVAAAFFIALEFQQSGSFIYDVYSGALGRRPVYVEYAADRQQVIGGANLDEDKDAFARAFVQRPEFVDKYQAATTAELFVDALIQNVQIVSGIDLNSERDALIARYATGLDQIEARGFVLRDVADNAAFKQAQYNPAFVLTEYFGYLRRDPEPSGYAYWLDVLNHGATGNYRGMVCAFVTSSEYQLRFSTVVTRNNGECGP
jgi:hypothetical protein